MTELNPLERHAAAERFLNNQTDEEWTRLRNVLLEEMPLRVIITIAGGNYQGAAAAGPVDLDILDYDNWHACDEGHEDDAEDYLRLEAEVEQMKNTPNAVFL